MVDDKKLPLEVANQIGDYVKLHGGKELVETLSSDMKLMSQPDFKAGLEEMRLLVDYCEVMGVQDKVHVHVYISILAKNFKPRGWRSGN